MFRLPSEKVAHYKCFYKYVLCLIGSSISLCSDFAVSTRSILFFLDFTCEKNYRVLREEEYSKLCFVGLKRMCGSENLMFIA